jgi:hypothetical protein
MTATDQQKVIKAGFTIIRADDHPNIRIKAKTPDCLDWRTIEKNFKSPYARDKRMAEMVKQPNVIID